MWPRRNWPQLTVQLAVASAPLLAAVGTPAVLGTATSLWLRQELCPVPTAL